MSRAPAGTKIMVRGNPVTIPGGTASAVTTSADIQANIEAELAAGTADILTLRDGATILHPVAEDLDSLDYVVPQWGSGSDCLFFPINFETLTDPDGLTALKKLLENDQVEVVRFQCVLESYFLVFQKDAKPFENSFFTTLLKSLGGRFPDPETTKRKLREKSDEWKAARRAAAEGSGEGMTDSLLPDEDSKQCCCIM